MRILAIDYGLARTGVAVSDPTGRIASPVAVLGSRNPEQLLNELLELIRNYAPERVLLGYPSRTDGQSSLMCQRVNAFGDLIFERSGIRPVFWDEKYTTVLASRLLHEGGQNTRKQRGKIDAAAAAVLLQEYLDAHPQQEN